MVRRRCYSCDCAKGFGSRSYRDVNEEYQIKQVLRIPRLGARDLSIFDAKLPCGTSSRTERSLKLATALTALEHR
jgi:hypothetical protein